MRKARGPAANALGALTSYERLSAIPRAGRALEVVRVEKRTCGDCRLCCKVMGVQSLEKPRGQWCAHACSKGCAIYDQRPTQCREFSCLWLLAAEKGVPGQWQQIFLQDERPDRIRVVATPFAGGVTDPRTGRMHRAVVISTGPEGLGRAEKLIQRLVLADFAVLVNDSERCLGMFLPVRKGDSDAPCWVSIPRGHRDSKLFDPTKASEEEKAEIRSREDHAVTKIREQDGCKIEKCSQCRELVCTAEHECNLKGFKLPDGSWSCSPDEVKDTFGLLEKFQGTGPEEEKHAPKA